MRRELCFVQRKAHRMENETTKRGKRERKVGYERERIIREGEGKKEKGKVREEERCGGKKRSPSIRVGCGAASLCDLRCFETTWWSQL
jgi:hypothetical protein